MLLFNKACLPSHAENCSEESFILYYQVITACKPATENTVYGYSAKASRLVITLLKICNKVWFQSCTVH
jgi:hypothetical protein